jgi:hypothetical protein
VVPLIEMLVAVELMLLPIWAGLVMARREVGLVRRLATLPAAMVLATVLLVGLALAAEGQPVGGVLGAQVVALGFTLLLAGVAAMTERLLGGRAAPLAAALVGWLLVAGVILVGPVAGLLDDVSKEALIRASAHANPLVVAERALGLDWLHQTRTYVLTPMAESYGYLLGDLAWWKTFLGYVFVGSGLVVFSLKRPEGKSKV